MSYINEQTPELCSDADEHHVKTMTRNMQIPWRVWIIDNLNCPDIDNSEENILRHDSLDLESKLSSGHQLCTRFVKFTKNDLELFESREKDRKHIVILL